MNQTKQIIKPALLALPLLFVFLALTLRPADAATYRTLIAQVPAAPTSSDTVTIWMDSDTAFGETAGVGYRISGVYTKVYGTFDDTGYPGANWRAEIPAQPNGTFVEYELFTRNESGSDYGFTGFNWSYTVTDGGGPGPITLVGARALWLDADTIAWNSSAASSYKLLYDADGGLTSDAESTACAFPAPAGPCYVDLTASGTISGYPKNPNATGLIRLTTGLSADNAKHLLKGQVAVTSYNSGGGRVAATGVQIQSVLDDLYVDNGSAESATLGVSYSGGVPTVTVWAPTAQSVTLRRYVDAATALFNQHPMTLDPASGVWSVTGDASWDRQFYRFDIEVYVPATDAVENNLVSDPYAISLSTDSTSTGDPRSQFVNLTDSDLKPAGWDALTKPALANFEDVTLYEMHVRDFSINDTTVSAADRGTYRAFTYDGAGPAPTATLSDGMDHLLQLKDAGLTHVHLLPAFDIASVIEDSSERVEPSISFNPATDRASTAPQAEVGIDRATDGFNWGYDPYHYGVPEGSYSTDPNGVARVFEFREMVSALNQNGLRVVMDVVYNHTAASGQDDKSVLDKVVPGYYYRYDTAGTPYTSSCCADTASEYAMMEKLMVDTLERFAVAYKIDGFRFDLMNLHTRRNMETVQTAINAIDPDIYLYGEGWDFGSAAAKGLTTCPDCYAKQTNMTGSGIGAFNDRLRDAAHGGYSTDSLQIRTQGFINGVHTDWNGYCYGSRFESDLHAKMDILRSALRGSGTSWNSQGNPFTDDPQESVPYVSKHDNETLFDQNVFKLPNGTGDPAPCGAGGFTPATTSMADRVRSQNMGLSLVGLSQGIPFFHMGSDILRSKSLDRNSYDSGDWFNTVDWTYDDADYDNNFGRGLPPTWDNNSRWSIMTPLLSDTGYDPAPSDAQASAAHMRETLRLRSSSLLFRLTTESDVNGRVRFYNGDNSEPALIVMELSDEPSPDLDASYESILVFFNADKSPKTVTIAGASGFGLHPVHTDGTDDDPVITGGASFNDATDTFTIPARTAVVFVSAEIIEAPSTIDWVGRMYPRGGVANAINEGGFAPSGFDIFVQVYAAGITPGNGQGSGLSCYLHWGQYGQPFADVAMVYNGDADGLNPGDKSNDEYKATLPQAVLNSLESGTVGFTAYCQKDGEAGKQWKSDEYNINGPNDDDQGDGLITVIPAADGAAGTEPPGGVIVHLFEWPWADVEKECTFLAEKGFSAVQVSPPNEHIVPTANQGGQATSDYPWWARYQPVTHDTATFQSRSGSFAEFQSMVATCGDLGVDIYVDAVINHMADIEVGSPPTGTAGTEYESGAAGRFYGTQYQADDFHMPDCTISSYKDRAEVQACRLSGLPDLDTGKGEVQAELRGYLQSLIDIGVAGFRIDGSKHMAAHEVAAILDGLTGEFYVYQEVIDIDTTERVRDWEYTPNGDVTEFEYSITAMGSKFNCGGDIRDLQNVAGFSGMMPSRFAQVFVDNHDNQRGHGPGGACVVDHRDGQVHVLASIFMLGHPYGHPKVTSSYYWSTNPNSDAGDSLGPPSSNDGGSTWGPGLARETRPVYDAGQSAGDYPANCSGTYPASVQASDLGEWVCEHRETGIANMVRFRQITDGQPLTDWQSFGANHIAFGRNDHGFVAINRTGSASTDTYATSMGAGDYCNIIQYDFLPATGQCVLPGTLTDAPVGDLIAVNASGQIINETVGALDAIAIHSGARMNTDYGSAPSSYGEAWHLAQGPVLGPVWRVDDGVSHAGDWAEGSDGGIVEIVTSAASAPDYLWGWVDFNCDGDFGDAGESIVSGLAITSSPQSVMFDVPAGFFADGAACEEQTVVARFRLTDSNATRGPDSPTGSAETGEVEDFGWLRESLAVPTAVELSDFRATVQADGSVLLEWVTSAEWDHAGFNVYRSPSEAFDATSALQLNAALIAAQGSLGQGASYSLVDDTVPAGPWYYFLEEVNAAGELSVHGPIMTNSQEPTSVATTISSGTTTSTAAWITLLSGIAIILLMLLVRILSSDKNW